MRLANEGGGRDNISVVIVDVLADPDTDGVASDASAEDDHGSGGSDSRVLAAVSGEARATALAGREPAAEPKAPPTRKQRKAAKRAQRRELQGPRQPLFTWRVLLFVIFVIGVIGVTFAAITYFARDTYYVGFDGNQVVIYRGHPGGTLWIKPDVVERTDYTRSEIPASAIPDIEAGKTEPSVDDAHTYLTNLSDEANEQGTGTTTTTAHTSTTG